MASVILPAGVAPVVPGSPVYVPPGSPAVAHVEWCRRFARNCLAEARTARRLGLSDREWLRALYFSRMALSQWRKRAERLAPMLVCVVWCITSGCAKAPALDVPSREVTTNFEVQPSPDGRSIVWSLQFKSRAEYHAFLETTADGAERAKIRELIAAGLKLHHIVGCRALEKEVTKLGDDGVAFIGSCESNPAHAVLAAGI